MTEIDSGATFQPLSGRATRSDRAFTIVAWGLGMIGIALPLGILGFLMIEGAPRLSWAFLTEGPASFPLGSSGGVAPAIAGTLALIAIGLTLALPLGIAGAIGLVEYSSSNSHWARVFRFGAECLAAVPAVIYGLFGYTVLVVLFGFRFSLLSGGLTLGLMMLPIILIGAEASLRGVEWSLREAALSLGVSRANVVRRVVLPKAFPGILAVTVLAAGHAAGSAAPVMLTASVAFARGGLSLDAPVMTLPTHLYYIVSEGADLTQAYATALVLVVGLLFANGCGALLKRRLAR
ncbi:MAG: phosphate ABC transporter permease PstA [Methyloligella sp. ZOD6]